ncbi:BppU family phage baseplate upper protein [Clostridium sp. HBUAS56010]|uniref:BppU family phage baseplate upper protein n=1 Tax=Clostridium sp. HBUAS56010 TaxID=2571127 RepID=UPI00117772C2|nr:BppU family phage baseplate upper protein [Clostridium sp. HBUAS56010]
MNYDVVLNANDIAALETQYAFTQGDYGNIQFSVRVKADGQYVTDAGRAYIVFTLPNGLIVTGDDMPKSVATYTYVFQGNELQSPGKVVADVKLVYATGQISSNKFTFVCRYDPLADKNIQAGSYITALQKIVNEGQEKIDYLQMLIDTLQENLNETALTRNDLQDSREPINSGLKALDAHMAQSLLLKSELANNGLTNQEGFALDARYGKTLKDLLDTTNSNLNNISNDLSNKAGLGENDYSGRQSITSIVGLGNNSYTHAQVAVRAPYNQNNAARAMIGFENVGNTAGILYLDTDGRLKWHGHDGIRKVIDWT